MLDIFKPVSGKGEFSPSIKIDANYCINISVCVAISETHSCREKVKEDDSFLRSCTFI